MFVVTVAFRSVPDRAADFLAALRDEPGCHRFDVCTDPGDPAAFFLYELYTDADAFEAHKATPHFTAFDALVRDWTAEKTVKILTLDPGTGA